MDYIICVAYKLTDYKWGSIDDQLRELAGVSNDGSGTGFGRRDLDFHYDTEAASLAAGARLETSGLKLEINHSAQGVQDVPDKESR